jgi:hypothetical protein
MNIKPSIFCAIAILTLAISPRMQAQEPTPAEPMPRVPQAKTLSEPAKIAVYQTAGAPADPKVPVRWNRYHDYALATELLQKLAAAHPNHFRLQSIGKSYRGREMWVATLSNFEQGKLDEKAGFWIDGGIHANEIQASEVVLYTAWYLAEMNGRSPFITKLLDERVFYLLPMMSPDSRDAHMHEPNTTHSPRSGQVPVDDDLDGLFDEDGSDDLDGDGHITQMRIRDAHGTHVPHEDYPELMVRAGAEERGTYRLLGSEGIDNDADGEVNEDGVGYYDPNRDFPWNWQPASVQRGSYRYPLAVPENRLMSEFVLAHPNIAGAQSYHNAAGMILRGPGAKNDKIARQDLAIYDRLGKEGELLLPGYKYLECATGLYEAHGTEFDWFYGMLGVFGFTNELNTPYNMFGNHEGSFFGNQETLHLFNRRLLFEDGFIPWHEVEHPQYGKIEVGGMAKNWVRQPASFMLEEECHRNMAFTLYHADQMPLVEIESIAVKPLAGDVQEVTAVIVNEKLIPTRTAHDVAKKINPPDRVQLSGTDLEVLTAFTADDATFDDPTEHARRPHDLRIDTIRRPAPLYVRWLVTGKEPFTVTVRSLKGGVASRVSKQEETTE